MRPGGSGLGLDIVGDGPMLGELRRDRAARACASTVRVSQETVVSSARGGPAVCVAGEEDFGMVAVEAQAAGKPVVAYARGGALETVEDGVTGVLFEEQTAASVAAAIARLRADRHLAGADRPTGGALRPRGVPDGILSAITARAGRV